MRADDLDLRALLKLDPEGAQVIFAGQRALVIDAVAMGVLRRYLVDNFGLTAARAVLTQFGFAHGWRMAEALKTAFDWESDLEWQRAGTRIHGLAGLFHDGTQYGDGQNIHSSYEAEQHILHFGRSDVATCWTISGLLSGYKSRSEGRELYVLEDQCVGKGDPVCHLIARTREEWGNVRADELHFYDTPQLSACLDISLQQVTESLKVAERRLRRQRRALKKVAPEVEDTSGMVARSDAMARAVELAKRAARVDSTVLITGESGVGKERIAHLIHDRSPRSRGPFIAVNCGAITESLLESELFGHARGAFTNANTAHIGLFEAANTGTLFLDEIGEFSPQMQVKLLRVLQEREVRRVGETNVRPVDVRVLAATNRDLVDPEEGEGLRSDLYYRLKVIEVHVPALRDRPEDILPLARILLSASAGRMKRTMEGLAPEVADQLLRYPWPGNVRELENAMERATALATTSIVQMSDLPEDVRNAEPRCTTPDKGLLSLHEVEKAHIIATLEQNDGHQARTAKQLQIGTATLYRKLKSYGMTTSRGSG
jgi:transcriptional regulator with PAS, ATPase and Fis domain